MKKKIFAVAAVAAVGLGAVSAGHTLASHVEPTEIDQLGNEKEECASLDLFPLGKYEIKGDGPDGELIGGYPNFSVVVKYDSVADTWSFSEADPLVSAALLKAGDAINVYDYRPTPVAADDGLVTPDGKDLSHMTFCGPDNPEDQDEEELTVSKTAVTSYEREHFWDIEKSVDEDEFWLYTNGSGNGTATWTVDVTYEGYEDDGFNVSGVITIVNTGDFPATINSVVDELAGTEIEVDCSFVLPHVLAVDATVTCDYDEDVDSKIDGKNVATVTTELDKYTGEAPILWGDPTKEVNDEVNVNDVSDLFGDVPLGSVIAPYGDSFKYSNDFEYADYDGDCGTFTYGNAATITETGQTAIEGVSVNVQCVDYETAFAQADGGDRCFLDDGFSRWGWTNAIGDTEPFPGTWDLWAAAGQCDTTKGTNVGTVTVDRDADGNVTVVYNYADGILEDETHVYAGTTKYPQVAVGRLKTLTNTVAPGQYYNASPLDGNVWVIAHAVVGIPDPDFGPTP